MAIWGGWPLFAIFPASYTLKANGNVFFRLWIQAMCVCSMYVCLCTHSVLDNNMYQDSSSSVHNNNRSEGNTGTSRSQPTTGRAHYQRRQLPQIPTLRKIKKTHQETWFPWQKQILKEVLSWNHFCSQDMKSQTNNKGELEWCTTSYLDFLRA